MTIQSDGCRFKAAQVQSWIFSSFSYFSNILSEVNINIFSGTMCPTGFYRAFWYTGSAFTKCLNHNKTMSIWFHLGYVEIISHSLGFLWIQIHENSKKKIIILTAWQTPVSFRALIGWLQVRGCPDPVMDFFFYFLNKLSKVNINIFSGTMCPTGLSKAFWNTGSVFTKYLNHNVPTICNLSSSKSKGVTFG